MLVPHLITALADEDANGTGGKNIVASAVCTMHDAETGGNAIILYDDENGSNGATSKLTDSNGQVVVYVTPGEYWKSVNGGTRRKAVVGNVGAFYGTASEISALRPLKSGQTAFATDYDFAKFKFQPSGYVAEYGDITVSTGVWALQADNWYNIKWFGAPGDASGVYDEINGAVGRIVSDGGGVLYFPNGRYGLEQKLVIPKNANISFVGERVSKDSALSANTDGAGVEIYAVNTMDEMFEWNGDATVTAASNLARGLYFRHLHLNGNNKAAHTIDCLNVDLLDFYDCRLTGMASGIRILFNGTYTSALLAGGLRVNHCNFGSLSGTHIELDGCTQCWIDGNWFAGTGVSKDFVINRSNKVNIINNEFNNATTCVFELNDSTGNEATQDIIINSNKIALASGTPVIFDDNRTNSSSKRVSFVGNTVVNGATIAPRDLHNPETNTFAYSQTSESKSFVSQSYHEDIHVDDAAGVAKLVNYETAGLTRWRHGANSDAESGSDAGSNFVLQRFDDSGSLLSTEMEIDRDTGRMHYSYASATGNGATIDANTGQVTTDSLTVAAGSSVNILFNNPRVNFTPVLVQMRSYSGAGDPIISKVTTGAQTFTITVKNLHASDALNSTLNFMFHVL